MRESTDDDFEAPSNEAGADLEEDELEAEDDALETIKPVGVAHGEIEDADVDLDDVDDDDVDKGDLDENELP